MIHLNRTPLCMAKIYPNKISEKKIILKPEPETIQFLLSYSKSICMLNSNQGIFELNKN